MIDEVEKKNEAEEAKNDFLLSLYAYQAARESWEKLDSMERPIKFGDYQYFKHILPARLDRVESDCLHSLNPYWNWYACFILDIAAQLETIEYIPQKQDKKRKA
jgi:hypothetical protein